MIKPIDEIPKEVQKQRTGYRELIRNDIMEAMDKKILKFEFIGDYNYKYLQQYAQDIANDIVRKMIYDWNKKHPEYRERYEYCMMPYLYYKINREKEIIKISSVKGETKEKRRVFCSICSDIDKALSEYAEEQIIWHEEMERKKKEKRNCK